MSNSPESYNLSKGSLAKICAGEASNATPTLQVIGFKKIAGSSSDRYRLLVSDGEYSNSFAMLATQLNHLIEKKELEMNAVIRVSKLNVNNMQGKKVIILLELKVVTPGDQVGSKLGNPSAINPDGTVNQNAPPAPDKRHANSPPDNAPPSKKPTPQIRSSILDPRPVLGSSSAAGHGTIQPIASLTPYVNKWTIQARVTNKSDIRRWSNSRGEGHLFSFDLLDASGDIKATAFKEQCDKFYNLVQVGKVYYLTNCQLKNANKQYNNTSNDYEITLKDNTEMSLCEDEDKVPTIVFDFVKISDLSNAAKDSLVDVIGIVKKFDEVSTIISSRTQKELKKRELTIVDESLTEVSLTIWGGTAETFDGSGNPVIAVKGAKVSDYNNVSLSAMSSSTIQMNPDIPQSHKLKGWFESDGISAATQSLTQSGMRSAGGAGGSMGANGKTLGEVKQENLGYASEKPEYYSTRATISMFQKDKALYQACTQNNDGKQCNKKVIDNNGSYRCEKCNVDNDTFNWRIILSFSLIDCTENQWVNCFQETAEQILGVSAEELGNYYQHNQDRYNQVFQDATFKSFNFRLRCKADNYNDEMRVRHTVVSVNNVTWEEFNSKMISELEEAGVPLPDSIEKSNYC